MQDINTIKEAINVLFNENKEIHIDVHSTRPRINVSNAPATITGVYKNLFTVDVYENGIKKVFSIPFTDLFIGKVIIKEI